MDKTLFWRSGIPKLSQYDPAVTMKRNRNCEPAAKVPTVPSMPLPYTPKTRISMASVSILVALLTNGWIEGRRTPTGA